MRKIIVLKIGTKSIVTKNGNIRRKILENIASDVLNVKSLGYHVVIVSSGAIAHGRSGNFYKTNKSSFAKYSKVAQHQILAMIGQDRLVSSWRRAFKKVNLEVGGIVYVNNMLRDGNKHSVVVGLLNLLEIGVVPVINENDAVTTEELKDLCGFGDNDQLGALVAEVIKADKYVMYTVVDGVYCPFSGRLLDEIKHKERKIEHALMPRPGDSNGSMSSKVKSAKSTAKVGIPAYIIKFDEEGAITRIISNEKIGTLVK